MCHKNAIIDVNKCTYSSISCNKLHIFLQFFCLTIMANGLVNISCIINSCMSTCHNFPNSLQIFSLCMCVCVCLSQGFVWLFGAAIMLCMHIKYVLSWTRCRRERGGVKSILRIRHVWPCLPHVVVCLSTLPPVTLLRCPPPLHPLSLLPRPLNALSHVLHNASRSRGAYYKYVQQTYMFLSIYVYAGSCIQRRVYTMLHE